MIVFPSYGLHARLILLRLDTGFIACTDVSNEAEVFFVVGSLVLELAKGYSFSVEHGHHLVYP